VTLAHEVDDGGRLRGLCPQYRAAVRVESQNPRTVQAREQRIPAIPNVGTIDASPVPTMRVIVRASSLSIPSDPIAERIAEIPSRRIHGDILRENRCALAAGPFVAGNRRIVAHFVGSYGTNSSQCRETASLWSLARTFLTSRIGDCQSRQCIQGAVRGAG